MVVVDVGANVGSFTKAFSHAVGPEGVVIAIEPQRLEELEALSPPARLIHAAVTDREGPVSFYTSRLSAQSSLYLPNVPEPTEPMIAVRGVTLDGLQAAGEIPARVDVIKVDAQGAEAAILRGASRLIETQHPVWYLEIWAEGLQAAGDGVQAIRLLLEPQGYQPESMTWDAACALAQRQSGHGAIDVLVLPMTTAAGKAS